MIIEILTGLLSGIVSGMGIGGGTILIPILVLLLKVKQHTAQSVNLLYFIPTAIIALFVHGKNKSVDFKITLPIVIFGALGAFIGARFAVSVPSDILKKLFGVFLLVMGVSEFFRK